MNHISDDEVPFIGRDPDLLEAFYREHAGAVRSYLVRRVGDPHLVADLTADIFLAAIEVAHRYQPGRGRPIAWLIGIARNKVADAQRKRARRLRAESRVVGRRLLDDDAISRIEDRIEAEQQTRTLYAALEALPQRDRYLVELIAVDGLTVTQAAVELGVKPGAARVRLHRCKARLRNYLDDPSLLESVMPNSPVLASQEASS